jgi:hypothetical protein
MERSMTEQAKNEERWSNNALTAGEMYWLTCHVLQRAEERAEPADTWSAAEAVFSELLGRAVTRWNIQTALSALDGVGQSQIVKPRGGGGVGRKVEQIDERAGRLVAAVGTLDRLTDERIVTAVELLNAAESRVDSIDEVLAREGARIDKIERRLEARLCIAGGFAGDLSALSQQNAELAKLVSRTERRVGTSARHDREIGLLKKQNAELAQLVTRLEQRVGTFEKPFAMNSGGEFHDGLPGGGSPGE